MTDRSGVEIDYCPECRGVWLDRGELDKIIERSAPQPQASANQQFQNDKNNNSKENYPQRPRKKESFLSDLFDF
mgnify:CR=1 FL=1